MISFRYHLVSIVAVLLALALGLLAGASVLDKGLVATLERQTEQWERRARELQGEVETLRAFAEEAVPRLVAGRLVGTQVVVVTQDGVDGDLLAGAQRALADAGASIAGVLSVGPRLLSEDPGVRQELADLLGQPTATSEDLPLLAARALADRLVGGPPRRLGTVERPDVLVALVEAGFVGAVEPAPSEAALREVGGPGQVVLLLGGGEGEPVVEPDAFLVPLARELVLRGAAVAAGESARSTQGFVVALRSGGATSDRMVTVGGLDEPAGSAALVLGLERLLRAGEGGDYGRGGESLLP